MNPEEKLRDIAMGIECRGCLSPEDLESVLRDYVRDLREVAMAIEGVEGLPPSRGDNHSMIRPGGREWHMPNRPTHRPRAQADAPLGKAVRVTIFDDQDRRHDFNTSPEFAVELAALLMGAASLVKAEGIRR